MLDATFGFFVWAAHLLLVYIAHAVSCQLGVGRWAFITPAALAGLIVGATIVLAGVVWAHAALRYRRWRRRPEREFRTFLTVGCDLLASIAIVWQLLAVGLIPVCR